MPVSAGGSRGVTSFPPTTPMCSPTTPRSPRRFPAMSSAFRSATMPASRPATSSPPSIRAIIGSPSLRRATKWRPSRRRSIASDGRSSPRAPPSIRPRRKWPPPRPKPKRATLSIARQQSLAKQQFASQQTLEQARSQSRSGGGRGGRARNRSSMPPWIISMFSRRSSGRPRGTLDELKTAQAQAERDLSFTVIRAPVDGVFSQSRRADRRLCADRPTLASLVPLSDVYIDANFKETQLARIRPVSRSRSASMHLARGRDRGACREPVAGFGCGVLAVAAG